MIRFIMPVMLAIAVSGCGTLNSVYRPFNINDTKFNNAKGALIDIKQRAILVKKKTTGTGADVKTEVIACAEPSPDAMSAYATEFAAKADTPGKAAAELSSATQESAAFTGLRTQSIQLLRDSMYRMCEAYMNGAITKEQYDILARRYQKHTVALLAIEQLTGTIKSPAITISTSGSAETARSISEMRIEIAAIDKKIADLGVKKAAAGVTDAEKTKIDAEVKTLTDDKESISKGIENARGTLTSGSATATVSTVGVPTQRGDDHIQAIAATVERIVSAIINTDDLGQLCFVKVYEDPKTLSEHAKKMQDICIKEFQNSADLRSVQIKGYQVEVDAIVNSQATQADKRKELDELSKRINFPGISIKSNHSGF